MNPDATLHLTQILEKTVSADKNERAAAEVFLQNAAENNLPQFVKTLSEILHHGGNSQVARMAAGLHFKNTLTSKVQELKEEHQKRWLAFPEEIRTYVKSNVVGTLGTENNRPSSAAQCVAYIAVAELPAGQWKDLIPLLVQNVIGGTSTEMMREATLEAIGYICQEIEHDVLVEQSNMVLTAIIHGMRQNEPSNHVRLAATTALHNSLEFTKANFDKESERNYIMEVVCEATQSTDIQVRVAALQCLVKIMSLYYQHMEPYMGRALFPITLEAMKCDNDEVALQGIEFWSNVSDEEVDLAIEDSEAIEAGRPPTRCSKFYAKGALQFLCPVLMQKLTKQEEFDDEDDWNPSKAAGVCLMLLATCCEDDIVPHVLPFVRENITSEDWRFRDAALMAFGSILGGLDPSNLKPLVEQAMPTLIKLMYDSSVVVRDTAAWTFGRVCEIIPDAAINETYLKPLLEAFVNGLKAEPRVAANVCWAFTGLAEAAYEAADGSDEPNPETYCLSQYFEFIVQQLLETTDRPDGAQANLRSAAYEALMEMVKNSPRDCYVTVQKTTMVILERLNQVLQMESHIQNHDRAQYNDLQSLLCATLQSVLRKVSPEDAPQISDAIMTALLQMFASNTCRSGGVQEDALMAVSTLVEVLGEGFLKYMDAFKPYLCMGLKNHLEHQVCGAAVGLTGDICRSLKGKVLPFCDEIMMLLLENLGDNNVHRSVKPQILSVFGDIALSIGPEFKKYLEVVSKTLAQASQATVDSGDYDLVEWLNELREGVLEAYTGIIQGLKGDGENPAPDVQILEPTVPFIIQFIIVVAQDHQRSDSCMASCAGLVGDLCITFGGKILHLLDVEPVNELLSAARRSKVAKTKTLASWATKEIRKFRAAAASCGGWLHGLGRHPASPVLTASWAGQEDDGDCGIKSLTCISEAASASMAVTDDGEGGDGEAADQAAAPASGREREPLVSAPGQQQPRGEVLGRELTPEERKRLAIQRQPSKDMDLDDLLPQVGEFGRYQKILLWFVCLPACIPCGFCAFNQLFMADTPLHWCRNLELERLVPNMSQEHRKMLSIPTDGFNGTYRKCVRYSVNWKSLLESTAPYELEPNSSWVTEPCLDGWEYDTTEITSSIVIDFDLVCNRDIYPTIGLAALNTGGPVGVYVFGVINDRFGRRLSFFLCLATLIIGSVFTAAAPEFWSWAVSRIIVGLTIPAIYQIPFIISLELVGPNYRSFVTVMTCLFYTLGLILLAGVTYLVRNWVTLALATSLPFLVYFIYWWFLPESPRWLLAKGRLEEASRVLETLARVNQKELPESFKQKLKQRMMLHRTKSEERRLKEGPSVFALCKTPNMRLKTMLITLNWFANNMVYVGLSYYGPALGNNEYLSFLLSSLVEIPSYLACWVVMDWWGRRWPLSICMILSGISCIVTVMLPSDAVTATLILYLFSKFAISASFLIIYPFAGELYPTQMRGVGIGASGYIAGLGLILIPFITYLGRENLVLPLVIMGAISVVGGVTGLRLPETLHHSLPQTVEEGEEFGKDWSMADCIQCIPKRPTAKEVYDDLSDAAEDVELPILSTPLQLPGPPPDRENSPLNQSFDSTIRRSMSIRGTRGSRSRLVRQASTMETPIDSSGFKMTYWF